MPLTTAERAEAVTNLLRLRRAERADQSQKNELRAVRDSIVHLVGPTVLPSEAARLLGISRPALKRWLDAAAIATVVTPEGRREIPLSELLDLLEDIDRLAEEDRVGRPLARVLRARERRAETEVDIDRLLPRRRGRGHRLAELQALAYHRLVAERLDEERVEDATRRVERWRASGRIHPSWADAWDDLLARPIPVIARTIAADTKRGRELRQTSPFAGALNEQERRRLVRAVEERGRS